MEKTKSVKNTQSVMAKTDDGTIQITFTIPFSLIKEKRLLAVKELGEKTEVPGFRKGKAPDDKVMEHLSPNTILEKTMSFILPFLVTQAIEEHKIKPIIYPKFELIKAKDGEDWEVRAVTSEAPIVELGDYKKAITGSTRAKTIWTPEDAKKGTDVSKKQPSKEDKEQQVLKNLVETVKVKIPKILVDEEADVRLSNLLSRLEKLGLSLESYLSSTGKTAQNLRGEYEKQASEGLALDFILSKIADEEKIQVDKSEIDLAIKASSQNDEQFKELDTPERRRFIETILKRRKALNMLLNLA